MNRLYIYISNIYYLISTKINIDFFSFSGHVPPSTRIKDNGNTEHIQRLKSLGLADEDIQVKKKTLKILFK